MATPRFGMPVEISRVRPTADVDIVVLKVNAATSFLFSQSLEKVVDTVCATVLVCVV